MIKRREKVQVWVMTKQEVLLLHRSDPKNEMRIREKWQDWQPVTGGVDPGELIFDAAVREVHEETAFQLDSNSCFSLDRKFEYVEARGPTVTEHLFVGLVDRPLPPVLDPREHDDFRWIEISDEKGVKTVLSLILVKRQQDYFQKALAYIRRKTASS